MSRKSILSFVFAILALLPQAIEAAPSIDLDGNTASVTFTATYTGYTFPTSFAQSPVITPDSSTTFTMMEVTLLNRPNGADEVIAQRYSFPAGISLSSYDSGTGLITLTGDANAAAYASALSNVGYRNTATDMDQSRRFISVRINDGIEWSEPVYAGVEILFPPANPTTNDLFVDTFDSFNASNWTVTGTTPTANGLLSLTDATIETASTFRALPMLMEVEATTLQTMPVSAGFTVQVISTNPPPTRSSYYGIERIGTNSWFTASGTSYGLTALEGGAFDPGPFTGTPRTYKIFFNHRGLVILADDYPLASSYLYPLGGHQGNYHLRVYATDGALVTIDTVRISEVVTANPASLIIAANDSSTHDFDQVDLGMVLQHSSTTPVGIQASLINSTPHGNVPQPIGKFWEIEAITDASYSADVVFDVSSTELNAAGLTSDSDVGLYRSTDNGTTWEAVAPSVVNRAGGYVGINGVTEFSLWTVGLAATPAAASNWNLYQ